MRTVKVFGFDMSVEDGIADQFEELANMIQINAVMLGMNVSVVGKEDDLFAGMIAKGLNVYNSEGCFILDICFTLYSMSHILDYVRYENGVTKAIEYVFVEEDEDVIDLLKRANEQLMCD